MVDRGRFLTLRASDEELAMLRVLAEESGLTASDYVRQFIRRAYTERESKPSKKSTRPKQK